MQFVRQQWVWHPKNGRPADVVQGRGPLHFHVLVLLQDDQEWRYSHLRRPQGHESLVHPRTIHTHLLRHICLGLFFSYQRPSLYRPQAARSGLRSHVRHDLHSRDSLFTGSFFRFLTWVWTNYSISEHKVNKGMLFVACMIKTPVNSVVLHCIEQNLWNDPVLGTHVSKWGAGAGHVTPNYQIEWTYHRFRLDINRCWSLVPTWTTENEEWVTESPAAPTSGLHGNYGSSRSLFLFRFFINFVQFEFGWNFANVL